ncbi:MAG: hypothetical protein LBS50_07990 [Prevotellaceae bacterium]|jgi:hypothetical protein|nr:hypothetical protein [Prevotellaceae bacterium]
MKDNFEIIIYVAIIAISIISSIVKKFATKKQKPVTQPVEKPTKNIFEDVLRELTQTQPVIPQPIPVPQPVVRKSVAPQPKPQKIVASAPVMNDRFALERHNYQRSEISQTAVRQIDAELNNAADWQKAFIYSEIFNRKY